MTLMNSKNQCLNDLLGSFTETINTKKDERRGGGVAREGRPRGHEPRGKSPNPVEWSPNPGGKSPNPGGKSPNPVEEVF